LPLLAVFVLTIAGLLFSIATDVVFDREAGDGKSVILAWTIYNLAVLAVTMAVCVELPRVASANSPGALPVTVRGAGPAMRGWAMRLTAEDAWIRGGPVPEHGADVMLEVPGIGAVSGRVARREAAGASILLSPSDEQRAALLTLLHTKEGAAGTTRSDLSRLVAGLSGRLLRGPG
jgi:cellulose synthase (UDP-forming)